MARNRFRRPKRGFTGIAHLSSSASYAPVEITAPPSHSPYESPSDLAYGDFIRRGHVRFMAFFVLSLLAHWLVLNTSYEAVGTPPSITPESTKRLVVRIRNTRPAVPGTSKLAPKSSIFVSTQPPPDVSPPITTLPVKPVPIAPRSTAGDSSPRGKTAAQLIEQAYKAVPDIVKELEKKESLVGPTEIFDPGFRRKLELARREQTRQKGLESMFARRPEFAVTADYGDYIGFRIGDKCLRMPVKEHSDPTDTRITMFDLYCRKQKSSLFETQSLLPELINSPEN